METIIKIGLNKGNSNEVDVGVSVFPDKDGITRMLHKISNARTQIDVYDLVHEYSDYKEEYDKPEDFMDKDVHNAEGVEYGKSGQYVVIAYFFKEEDDGYGEWVKETYTYGEDIDVCQHK